VVGHLQVQVAESKTLGEVHVKVGHSHVQFELFNCVLGAEHVYDGHSQAQVELFN
jgi:catechol-2,3-dioxygenase